MTIYQIIQTLIALGVFAPLIKFAASLTSKGITLIEAHTKNKNINMFLTWVDQAVIQSATAYKDDTNEIKKAQAINFVTKRLQANNLLSNFSPEQISGAIELAVKKLNNLEG